jgi:predicted transcriptional regulator
MAVKGSKGSKVNNEEFVMVNEVNGESIIKGIHHHEDLQDIYNRLKAGESPEVVAKDYDKRVAVIRKFASVNGLTLAEAEYYDNVEDVLKNMTAKFYNITGDDLKTVIQKLLDGEHPADVAKETGKSVGAITNFAKANRIRLPEGRRGRKESGAGYSDEQVTKVIELKGKGYNTGAIAHETGLPYNAVSRIIREKVGTTKRETTELPPKDVIEKMHHEGATQTAIATALKIPLHRVAKAFKQYGLIRSAV